MTDPYRITGAGTPTVYSLLGWNRLSRAALWSKAVVTHFLPQSLLSQLSDLHPGLKTLRLLLLSHPFLPCTPPPPPPRAF